MESRCAYPQVCILSIYSTWKLHLLSSKQKFFSKYFRKLHKKHSVSVVLHWIRRFHWALYHQIAECTWSCPTPFLVSEPDPRKIGKEGLAHRPGWKCTLRNVRNFINCRTLQSPAEPDTSTNVLSFLLAVYSLLKPCKNEAKRENSSHAVSISNKRTSEC